METNRRKNLGFWLILIVLALVCAAATAYWSPGEFRQGFFAALVIAVPGCLMLGFLWRWGGRGKTLAWMMLLAFALRLAFGLGTFNLLPRYGYPDEPRQQAGYLSDDAWRRDEEAWRIAQKEDPSLAEVITRPYNNDQYGGLAAVSVLIYQHLSSDTRRPGLILLLGAFFAAAGVPFLRKALQRRFAPDDPAYRNLANIAAWIYVFYPDSVIFGGSLLREPFFNSILAAALWALLTLRDHWKKSGLVLLGSLLFSAAFSHFVAEALLVCVALWVWGDVLIPANRKWLTGGVLLILAALIIGGVFLFPSISEFVHFDIHTSERNSGWVEKTVGEIGGQFRPLFLTIYGVAQPVLPAILFYKPTTPYWKIIGTFRASGWYLIVPFLFYGLFSAFRVKRKPEKTLLTLNALFVIGWIFISSFRAGGDQWDNPRYRVIFLPWLAFFSAWGYCYARKTKDWWLARWIAIELIFVGFFSQWYYSRYSGDAIRRFPFWRTVVYIVICCAVVFLTGLIGPLRRKLGRKRD